MAENQAERRSGPFGFVVAAVGVTLQMLGLSGMADSVVHWRGFLDYGVMRHYNDLIMQMAGGIPSPALSAGIGYMTSCVGFFVAAYQTMQEHRRYLAAFKLPRDYTAVEDVIEFDDGGLDKVEAWAHRRSRNAVTRLVLMSLIWPLFLLWALFVWTFAPRRRIAIPLTDAERRSVEYFGFDYHKASRREAFAFLKWTLLALLGFVAILFLFSDFTTP